MLGRRSKVTEQRQLGLVQVGVLYDVDVADLLVAGHLAG